MKIKKLIINNKINIIFLLILFVGIFLRFYKLGQVPVGFHRDEAFLGYNAFSILLTGRDMTGAFLPLHLESFLYSPAGYSYFSIPSIFVNGLNEFSIRFASAFFGSLTIILTFLLATKLISDKKLKIGIGLFSALFLALSPWHINLSRVATENVLVVFLITLGTYLFFCWAESRKKYFIIVSTLCFFITLFMYQASRSFLPLFLPVLFLLFRPKLQLKEYLTVGMFFIIVIIVPILFVMMSPNLSLRLQMLSIFKSPQTQLVLEEQIREDGSHGGSLFATRLNHNKVINYSSTFLQNYFKHFSFDFLFADTGLPIRYRVPNMGLLYLIELPLLLLGFFMLANIYPRLAIFLGGWVLLAPLGSGLTYDDIPNLQRTLLMLPALSLLSGAGAAFLWSKTRRYQFGVVGRFILLILILYGALYYFHQYYMHQVYHRPWFRQEGFKELVRQVDKYLPSYKKAVIAAPDSTGIYFLFYHSFSPSKIQQSIKQSPTDSYGMVSFNKYEFSSEECPLSEKSIVDPFSGKKRYELIGKKGILYANSGNCKLSDKRVKTLAEIKRPDNTIAFRLQVIE